MTMIKELRNKKYLLKNITFNVLTTLIAILFNKKNIFNFLTSIFKIFYFYVMQHLFKFDALLRKWNSSYTCSLIFTRFKFKILFQKVDSGH